MFPTLLRLAATPLDPSSLPRRIVDAPWFRHAVVLLIVASAVLLGVETSRSLDAPMMELVHLANRLILGIFVIELALRILAYRREFFTSGWNLFDLGIVLLALIPPPGPLQMLRALRILRALRMVSVLPSLRRVINGLLDSLPGLASIVLLLVMLLYVAAVMATHLYRELAPEHFGDIATSLLTLFQVMTLEDWPDIAKPIMAVDPWAWLFFSGFILLATFMVLNLFIGVVVSAIQSRLIREAEADAQRDAALASDIHALREEVQRLREALQPGGEAGARGTGQGARE